MNSGLNFRRDRIRPLNRLLVGVAVGLLACGGFVAWITWVNYSDGGLMWQQALWTDVGVFALAFVSLGFSRHPFGKRNAEGLGVTLMLVGGVLFATMVSSMVNSTCFECGALSPILQGETVGCLATGGPAGVGVCEIALTNTGAASSWVSGCTIGGETGALSVTATGGAVGYIALQAGTTSAAPVDVYCQASAVGTSGADVAGSLNVPSGAPIAFTGVYS